MKSAEIKQLTTQEIIERIEEDKQLLVKNKINHAISPLDNPMQIKQLRREIARLMTELRHRELNDNK